MHQNLSKNHQKLLIDVLDLVVEKKTQEVHQSPSLGGLRRGLEETKLLISLLNGTDIKNEAENQPKNQLKNQPENQPK